MGLCSRFLCPCCYCSPCCNKKKEKEPEPTEEEIEAKKREEEEQKRAEAEQKKIDRKNDRFDELSEDGYEEDSDDDFHENSSEFDATAVEHHVDKQEFSDILHDQDNDVFHTDIFELVDEAKDEPKNCLFNYGRPRRWHVDLRDITAENLTEGVLPEVFLHFCIGGPSKDNEFVVDAKDGSKDHLYQLGARGLAVRTRSRKNWLPGEIQVFTEEYSNDSHIASYEQVAQQCLRIELWILHTVGMNVIHSHAILPLQELLRDNVLQSVTLDSFQFRTPTVNINFEFVFAEVFDFALRPVDWWVTRDSTKLNVKKNQIVETDSASGSEDQSDYEDFFERQAVRDHKNYENVKVQFLQFELPKQVSAKRAKRKKFMQSIKGWFFRGAQTKLGSAVGWLDWVGPQTIYTHPSTMHQRMMNCNEIPKSNRKADMPDAIVFRGTNEQLRRAKMRLSLHETIIEQRQLNLMLKDTKEALKFIRRFVKSAPVIAGTTITLDNACNGVTYRQPIFDQRFRPELKKGGTLNPKKHKMAHQEGSAYTGKDIVKFGEVGGMIALRKTPRFQQATVASEDFLLEDVPCLIVKVCSVNSMDPPDQRDPLDCEARVVVWFDGNYKSTRLVRSGLSCTFNDVLRFPVLSMETKDLRHQVIYVDVMLDDNQITQHHVGQLEIPLEDVFINPDTGKLWEAVGVQDKRMTEDQKKRTTYAARVAYLRRKCTSTFATRGLETTVTLEIWTTPIYDVPLKNPFQYYSEIVKRNLGRWREEFHDVAESLMVQDSEHATHEDHTRWFQFEAVDERGVSWMLPKFLSRVRSTLTNEKQIAHYCGLLKFNSLEQSGQSAVCPRMMLQFRRGSTLDHCILHASLLLGTGDPYAIPLVCLGTAWDGTKIAWVAIIRFEEEEEGGIEDLVVELVDVGMRRSFVLRNRFAHPQHMRRIIANRIPATKTVPTQAQENEDFRRRRVVWQQLRQGNDEYKPLMLEIKQHEHPLIYTNRYKYINPDSYCTICDKRLFDVHNGTMGFVCEPCLRNGTPVFVCWLCAAAVYLCSNKYRNPVHQDIQLDIKDPVQFPPKDEVVLPYRSVDTVFSEHGLWINVQHKSPAHIYWDLGDPNYWHASLRGVADIGRSPLKELSLETTFSEQWRRNLENETIPSVMKAVSNARTERRLSTHWNQDNDLTRYLNKGLLLFHQIISNSKNLRRYSPKDIIGEQYCGFLMQQWRTILYSKLPLGFRAVGAPVLINEVLPDKVAEAVVRRLDFLIDTRVRNPQFTIATFVVCMPNYVVCTYVFLLIVHPLTTWQHAAAASNRRGVPMEIDAMQDVIDTFVTEPTFTDIPVGVQEMQRDMLPREFFNELFPNFWNIQQADDAHSPYQEFGSWVNQAGGDSKEWLRPAEDAELDTLCPMDFEMFIGDILLIRLSKARPLVDKLIGIHGATTSATTNDGALSEWWATVSGDDIEFMTSESDDLTTALVSDPDVKGFDPETESEPSVCVIGNSWIRTLPMDGWEKGALCYYWEMEITEIDDQFSDKLGIGITQMPPTKLTHAPRSADFFVPSFVLYFDGNFWNSNTNSWEKIIIGHHGWRLEEGDKIGVLITPTRQFILFVNELIHAFIPAQCPGKGRLFPVAELLGSVNAVTLLPDADAPKWQYPKLRGFCKHAMKKSKITLSKADKDQNYGVASYDGGSTSINLEQKNKDMYGVAFTDSPLNYEDDGRRYFEIVVGDIVPHEKKKVKIGLAVGVTLSNPSDYKEAAQKAVDVPFSWLVGFDGKQFDGVRNTWSFCSWNPLQLKKGDVIGIIITITGQMMVYVNSELVTRASNEVPCGHNLYGIVDLLGPFQSVTINPKARAPEPELSKWSVLYKGQNVKVRGDIAENVILTTGGTKPSEATWSVGDGVMKRYNDVVFFEVRVKNTSRATQNNFAIGVTCNKVSANDEAAVLNSAFKQGVCYFRFDGTFFNSFQSARGNTKLDWDPPEIQEGDRICIELADNGDINLYVNSNLEVAGPSKFQAYNVFPVVELSGTVDAVQLILGDSPPTVSCTRWNASICGQRCTVSSDGLTATYTGSDGVDSSGTVFGDAPLQKKDKMVSYKLICRKVDKKSTDEGMQCGITICRPELLGEIPDKVEHTPKSWVVGGPDGRVHLRGSDKSKKHKSPLNLDKINKGDTVQIIWTQDNVLCALLNGVMKAMIYTKILAHEQIYPVAGLRGRAAAIEIDTKAKVPQLFMRGWHPTVKSAEVKLSYNTVAILQKKAETGLVIGDLPLSKIDGKEWFEFRIMEDSKERDVQDFRFAVATTAPEEMWHGQMPEDLREIPFVYGMSTNGLYFHGATGSNSNEKAVLRQLNWKKNSFSKGDEIGILLDRRMYFQLFVNGVFVLRSHEPIPENTPVYPVVQLGVGVPRIEYLPSSLPPTAMMRKWSSVVFGRNVQISPDGLSVRKKSREGKDGNGCIGEAPLKSRYFEIEIVRVHESDKKEDKKKSKKKDDYGMGIGFTTTSPEKLGVFPNKLREVSNSWIAGYGGSVFDTAKKRIDATEFRLLNPKEGDTIGVSAHTRGHVVVYLNKVVEYTGQWVPDDADADLFAIVDLGSVCHEMKYIKGAEAPIPFMTRFKPSLGIDVSNNGLVATHKDMVSYGKDETPLPEERYTTFFTSQYETRLM